MELEGQLGQLMLIKNSSNEKRLHFTFNSSISKNEYIFEKISAKNLVVIVENNELLDNNHSNLMETELEFKAVFKHQNYDCDESNGQSLIESSIMSR